MRLFPYFQVIVMAAALALTAIEAKTLPSASPGKSGDVADRALSALARVVSSKASWEEMHAAEALIACGQGKLARHLASRQWAAASAPPFRVSAWRMLASTSPNECERAAWINQIKEVLRSPTAPDQVQAIEVLDKDCCRLDGPELEAVRLLMTKPLPVASRYFCLWALALAKEPGSLERITQGLSSLQALERGRAAATLRGLRTANRNALEALKRAAQTEPSASPAHSTIVSSALGLNADPASVAVWRRQMETVLFHGSPRARFLDARPALLAASTPPDRAGLEKLLADPEADTRITAAWIILHSLSALSVTQPAG
jgi:hypothetical protein